MPIRLEMRNAESPRHTTRIPSKGERIELLETRTGVRWQGTVHYSDHLQILVKWDNGRSESLLPGVHRYRVIE